MTLVSSRRTFITGLVSLLAAPAIVKAASLMPVSTPKGLPKGVEIIPFTRMDVLFGYLETRHGWAEAVDSIVSSLVADRVMHPRADLYRDRSARALQQLPPDRRESALVEAAHVFTSGVPELTKLALGLPV